MTGCDPRRLGLHRPDNPGLVLQPVSTRGLNPDEVTIAKVLKRAGYDTSLIGKWHLGDQTPFLPTRQGFDEYLGDVDIPGRGQRSAGHVSNPQPLVLDTPAQN